MARVTAIRCFIACYQNDVAAPERPSPAGRSRNCRERISTIDQPFMARCGDTYRRIGRWEEAKECYLKTLDFSHAPSVRMQSVHLFGVWLIWPCGEANSGMLPRSGGGARRN